MWAGHSTDENLRKSNKAESVIQCMAIYSIQQQFQPFGTLKVCLIYLLRSLHQGLFGSMSQVNSIDQLTFIMLLIFSENQHVCTHSTFHFFRNPKTCHIRVLIAIFKTSISHSYSFGHISLFFSLHFPKNLFILYQFSSSHQTFAFHSANAVLFWNFWICLPWS